MALKIFDFSSGEGMIKSFILVYVAFNILLTLLPQFITYLINISTIENMAFASFFEAGGVVMILLSAGLLYAIMGIFGLGKSKR